MKQWYGGFMILDMLGFKANDQVFYRRAVALQEPLAVGSVIIVFSVKKDRSFRFAESMGITQILSPHPNRVNPEPAPEESNIWIEEKYRGYLSRNPLATRHPREERARLRALRQENASVLTT